MQYSLITENAVIKQFDVSCELEVFLRGQSTAQANDSGREIQIASMKQKGLDFVLFPLSIFYLMMAIFSELSEKFCLEY